MSDRPTLGPREWRPMPGREPANLNKLAEAVGFRAENKDGLLLLHTDGSGLVTPIVLQLGLMTEGRIEANLMPIFNSIVRARAVLNNPLLRTVLPVPEDSDA